MDRPTPKRVARRALALTAVTARAILEQGGVHLALEKPRWNPLTWLRHLLARRDLQHQKLLQWGRVLGINNEFEPEEWEVLQCQPGHLEPRQQVSATWRLEGLAVLAWALCRFELPPHEQLVECHSLWQSLGILNGHIPNNMMKDPELRPLSELQAMRRRLLAIHWRLTNFRIRPTPMDFVRVTERSFGDFDRTAWFSPQEVAELPLVDGDLAIQGVRLDSASPDDLSVARSIAYERNLAANWLCEGPGIYSDTVVNT